jgi:hypothetical protein
LILNPDNFPFSAFTSTWPLAEAASLTGFGSAISSIGAHEPATRPKITNQSQILIDLHRHTISSRAVEQLKIATARSLKNTGRNAYGTGTEPIPAALLPPPRLRLGYGLQCGATPKLTMIAGARLFSIRTLSVRKLLLNPTIPDENGQSSGKAGENAKKAHK